MYDVVIIGAGVTGGMLARELTRFRLSVCLLEKENDVACGASKANSGIIHGGYDPVPGTLKAKLNTEGVELLFEAAKELNVPHRRCGSLVCAFGKEEDAQIAALSERGKENGIDGLSVLSGDEARSLEPRLSSEITSALLVPNAGIICPYALTIAAVGNAMDNGAALLENFEVAAIQESETGCAVTALDGRTVEGRFLVNCAGGFADRVARLVGDDSVSILPRAGEYLLLDKSEGATVSRTIFQTPTANGKGILVTPTADGNLLLGPTANAVSSPDCRDTTRDGLNAVERLAKKSVPSLAIQNVITAFTGVRASTEGGDFIIRPSAVFPRLLHVAAIDSPGLTCCVAIARYAIGLLREMGLSAEPNPQFNGNRPDPAFFRKLSAAEKDAYIREHPDYGRIVCRCETVSEGEIRDAIRRTPCARDLDAVKRRTRSGMGRCQGGFCMPFVSRILAEELGVPVESVTKSGKDSFLFAERP